MDDVADECACAAAHGDLIGKSRQHALSDVGIHRSRILKQQSLRMGDIEELFKELRNLPG
jgi:hypothetical protein